MTNKPEDFTFDGPGQWIGGVNYGEEAISDYDQLSLVNYPFIDMLQLKDNLRSSLSTPVNYASFIARPSAIKTWQGQQISTVHEFPKFYKLILCKPFG